MNLYQVHGIPNAVHLKLLEMKAEVVVVAVSESPIYKSFSGSA